MAEVITADTSIAEQAIDLDSIYGALGLVDIKKLDERFIIDLRYASDNNFIRKVLYDSIHSAYLQRDVAERLVLCQNYLDSLHPGYRLKIFDAVRPLQVQRYMWDALDTIPLYRRGHYVSNPIIGSVHNFGAAVDLTICDAKGKELDMGAGYDDFREIAYPSREYYFLKTGELTDQQLENRKLLRKVMVYQQFRNIPTEWWHFNACSRVSAEYNYPALLTESGRSEKRSAARNAYQRYLLRDSLQKNSAEQGK